MHSHSEGTRLAINVGSIGIGSALMSVGEGMARAAAAGYTEKQASHVDDKGRNLTTFVQVPLTRGDRAVKGAAGTTFLLGGAVLNGLGFYNLFFAH